jgi:hypothetical protein
MWRQIIPGQDSTFSTSLMDFEIIKYNYGAVFNCGARGNVDCWGTILQGGKSRLRFPTISLHFQLI